MREPKDVTILVVDDEEALRKAIVFDFKRKGFQVLDAANGQEAFELVSRSKVDVVLSDVRMPGGDGVELLDRIKAVNPGTPVVMFITGFADLSLEDAYNKGADAVFSKPFDRKELMSAVFNAITSKEELWGLRKTERLATDFEIALHFPELNLPIQGKVLNIGRGGIFVALDGKLPSVGTRVAFKLGFDQGTIREIDGEGLVRWSRHRPQEALPSGCGIEFEYLADGARQTLIKLIDNLKTKAFIPKN